MEKARVWDEAKAKEEISRVNAEVMKRVKKDAKTRVWEKAYAVQRAAVEAAENIRARAEAERAKRKRAEAEERAKSEADMKEKAEKTRKARDVR